MKKIIHTIILLFISGIFNSIDAQNIETASLQSNATEQQNVKSVILPTGYYELSFGPAIPIGSFANESGKSYGEYATLGNNFNLSVAVPINHSNFGIAFIYSSYNNFFDMNTYLNNMQMSDPSKNYTGINSDEYDESFIMFGMFATYPVERLSFDFRLLGGVAFCHLPEVDYGANPINENYYTYQWDTYSNRSTSFVFDIGGNIRYKIRRMSVMLGIDFISTNPSINTTEQYTDPNGNNAYTHVGGNISISNIGINLGIGYRIR